MFGAAVVTMRAVKLQERHGRDLKLVSGVVMVTLALVMIGAPEVMKTVGGALAVFAIATLLAGVGIAAERVLNGERWGRSDSPEGRATPPGVTCRSHGRNTRRRLSAQLPMARYVVHVRTPMPAAEAFEYMADLRNSPEWDPGVDRVEQVTGNGAGPGAAFDVAVKCPAGR